MRIDIADADAPEVAAYMGLRDHAGRQRRESAGGDMAGSFMAEGDVVIERALRAGMHLQSVLVDARRTSLVVGVGESVPLLCASPAVLQAVCGRPKLRDPIARFVRPAAVDPAMLLERSSTVVVLEGIVNPTNMGVITRCAAGLGIDAVLLDPTSCDPLYRRAVRVSMGEVFAIPHARLAAFADGLSVVRDHGYTLAALTPDPAAAAIGELRRSPGDRLAIVIGTEGPGLTAATLAAADTRLRIQMAAEVDSINVGTAAAVAFYALRQVR